MTTEEINEGNKLIAEWLGYYVTPSNGKFSFVCKEEKKPEHLNQAWEWRLEESKYHLSWNWQIPVWAKLCKSKESKISEAMDESMLLRIQYMRSVSDNNPESGFKIIISILKRIHP
jgi:hypothetical protein